MEKARYNTEPFPNLSQPLNNVKPSNFWGSHQSARSFEYFLSTSSRDLRRDSSEKPKLFIFSDTLVLSGVNEILEKRYESLDVSELSELNRTKLILELRKQFNAPPKQLARVLGLSLREVVNSLNWQ